MLLQTSSGCQVEQRTPQFGPWAAKPSVDSDDIDRDLHRRNHSSVLEPMKGAPVLWPAHSRSVVLGNPVSMVGDHPMQDVDSARPAMVVVNRAEDPPGLEGHHSHAELAPFHALHLGPEINCGQ